MLIFHVTIRTNNLIGKLYFNCSNAPIMFTGQIKSDIDKRRGSDFIWNLQKAAITKLQKKINKTRRAYLYIMTQHECSSGSHFFNALANGLCSGLVDALLRLILKVCSQGFGLKLPNWIPDCFGVVVFLGMFCPNLSKT